MNKNKNKDDYISESSAFSIAFQLLAIVASIMLYWETEDEFVVLVSCIYLILSILTLTMQIKIYNYAKHGDSKADSIANKNLDDSLSMYIILVLIVIAIIIISGIMKMYYLR